MIALLLLSFVSLFGISICELELRHGNAYAFMNVADGHYLTSQQHRYRARIGIYVGQVFSSEFAGTPNQYFELIRFSSNNNQSQYWAIAQQYPLNELTALPNAQSEQPFPIKNLVEFVETGVNSKRFVIRSTELKKCIRPEGKDRPVKYVECDVDDETQQFLSVAPFLSRGDSNWHSADLN